MIFSYAIREESQGTMRYSKYMKIAATKEEIKTESLPPSENATQQHSYWVYLQVMDWKFLEEWGWVPRNGWNHHVYTEQPATPVDLLKFVRCKCKLFSKSPCLTNFSCKKMDYTVLQHWTLLRWRLSKQKSHKEFGGRYLWIKRQKKYFWHF